MQALIDDPDDLTIRLVYADWLEENGDPARAELVRIQAEPGGRGGKATPRERQLLDANRPALVGGGTVGAVEWLSLLGRNAPGDDRDAAVPVQSLSGRSGAVVSPGARHGLDLRGSTVHWDRVAESPVMDLIHELHLSRNSLREKGVRALLASNRLTGLHTLSLQHNGVNERCLEALVRCTTLPRLKRLDLSGNYLYSQAIRQLLLGGGLVGQLTSLSLSSKLARVAGGAAPAHFPGPDEFAQSGSVDDQSPGQGGRGAGGFGPVQRPAFPALTHNQLTNQSALSLAGASELEEPIVSGRFGQSDRRRGGACPGAGRLTWRGLRGLCLGRSHLSAECRAELQQELGDRLVG